MKILKYILVPAVLGLCSAAQAADPNDDILYNAYGTGSAYCIAWPAYQQAIDKAQLDAKDVCQALGSKHPKIVDTVVLFQQRGACWNQGNDSVITVKIVFKCQP